MAKERGSIKEAGLWRAGKNYAGKGIAKFAECVDIIETISSA